jgi:hypothetical protein
VPVWELHNAECKMRWGQAPVVTVEITLETHRLRCFSLNPCGPDSGTAEQFPS